MIPMEMNNMESIVREVLKQVKAAPSMNLKLAKELMEKGCFFVDGTNYTKKFFCERIGPCDCEVGQKLPRVLIP